MRFVDLFAGLGGFHLGLSRLGHECVFASEIDPELRQVYARNFGLHPAGDIRAIDARDIPTHDVLCAGFPCQPFSKAGAQRGFDCPQWGDLFAEILRILQHHRPAYFILENVGNLRRHNRGRTWHDLIASLRELGYSVDYASRSPQDVGTPHARERIFVVGSRAGLPGIVWPSRGRQPREITAVLDESPADARPLSAEKARVLEIWQDFLDRFPEDEELPSFPIWSAEFQATYPYEGMTPWAVGAGDLSRFRGAHGRAFEGLEGDDLWAALPPYARAQTLRFPRWKERFIQQNRALYARHRVRLAGWLGEVAALPPSHQKLEWNCKGGHRNIWDYLIQFRASGIRVKLPSSAPTLVAINTTQVPIVAWERRYLTARECARLQGLSSLGHLPERTEAAFGALGNAVNADLVEQIASALLLDTPPSHLARSTHERAIATPTTIEKPRRGRMATAVRQNRINIRPPVNVLSVLRHLNYQPWYALAEFVDNALQSFLTHRKALQQVNGRGAKLCVSITIDPADDGRIVVRDNAAGIHGEDYPRAFRAAEVPPDRSGLSEFGMGMKSAACWFAPHWTVRTSALGESVERTVTFDINTIVRDSLEELEIRTQKAKPDSHYTEIVLSQVYRLPQKRTLGKIRDHLASMYRIFLREGLLELSINNEPLVHEEPKILTTPFFKTPNAKAVEWRKDIDIDLGGRRRITGFAALREKGSTSDAGFALFRRKRVIQGSADQGYRPETIFGRSNSYIYQRLFGELHLEGFEVSHTKDGFRWDEYEDDLLEELKTQLDSKPLALLQQALGYRAKPTKEDMHRAVEAAVIKTADAIQEHVADTLDTLDVLEPEAQPPESFSRVRQKDVFQRTIEVERHGTVWEIVLEACHDESMGDWVEVINQSPTRGVRRLGVRLALAHPFTERFGGTDPRDLEPLMRIAAAIGLAETTAREVGVKKAGTVRVHFNELLREALSGA